MEKKSGTTKQIKPDSRRPRSAILIGESAFLERDENTVEFRLAAAWDDDGQFPISWALGEAEVKLKARAEKADDREWLDSIRKELNALPQFLPQGGKTRDQMIAAAISNVAEQGNIEAAILVAAEALRHEAVMREAKPLWEWLEKLRIEAEKYPIKDGRFLKSLIADLTKAIRPTELTALSMKPEGGVQHDGRRWTQEVLAELLRRHTTMKVAKVPYFTKVLAAEYGVDESFIRAKLRVAREDAGAALGNKKLPMSKSNRLGNF